MISNSLIQNELLVHTLINISFEILGLYLLEEKNDNFISTEQKKNTTKKAQSKKQLV